MNGIISWKELIAKEKLKFGEMKKTFFNFVIVPLLEGRHCRTACEKPPSVRPAIDVKKAIIDKYMLLLLTMPPRSVVTPYGIVQIV